MGAVGASKGTSGFKLSKADMTKITSGIQSHTSEQIDGAEENYKNYIAKQKNILDNYKNYVAIGKIKNKQDEWWQGHQESYDSLVAQYDFFKKERKRLNK